MLFLIDGYNVTMTDPATSGLSKEQQREALVRRLSSHGRALLGKGEVVVVFDAHGQLGTASERIAGISVVFAPDADTEIVRRCAVKGEITVISSDKRLQARISQDVGRRVVYREASTCFESGSRRPRASAPSGSAPDDRPAAHADEITRELERLWLPGTDEEESS